MTFEETKKKRQKISNNMDACTDNMGTVAEECERVADVLRDAKVMLDNLDRQFEEKTGLTSTDMAFLFIAIGLQMIRQYLVTNFKERKDDQAADREANGKREKHSCRMEERYNISFDGILRNPVPFDTTFGSRDFDLNLGGGFNHRASTLGHDPLLGWIFGTANIATSTLTTWKFETYHVKTGEKTNGNKQDKIYEKASTIEMFSHIFDKMLGREGRWHDPLKVDNEGWCDLPKVDEENDKFAGPAIIALSVLEEARHLKGDIYSKVSLPLPVISTISPEIARKLANYGLDMANILTVTKQVSYAAFINMIIAMIHKMFYDGTTEEDEKLYEVRTRKILSYSNAIAASSNIAVVAITERFDLLDIGGIAVAIYELITNTKFKYEVKREFVFGNFEKMSAF